MIIYRILSNNTSYYELIDFSYRKEANGHSIAKIKAHITEDMVDECIRRSCTEEWGSFTGVDRNGVEKNIFSGYITKFSVGKNFDDYSVEIELTSGTYLMDLTQRIFVHQDPSETYEQIIEDILDGYKAPFGIYDSEAKKTIDCLRVQYEETDWKFVNRLASILNLPIISKTDHEGVSLEFGLNKKQEVVSFENVHEMFEGRKNGKDFCVIKSYDYVEIGTPVTVNNKKLYVYSAEGNFTDGILKNTYELRCESEFTRKEILNEQIVGASIKGSVSSVSGDQVMVTLEKEKKHSITLFPYATIYSSPDGSGWYCMPEVGDQIRLYFPTVIEKEAYVISAVHLPVDEFNTQDENHAETGLLNGGGDNTPPRTNPDYKSIKNKEGKEILLKPDGILITNNNGMYIEINDETGISIVSDKKISFSSDSSISIVSANEGVQVAANSEILFNQNGTSLQLKNDINVSGGKIKTVE